ncbi:hypothetical protein [Pseudomonas sp. BMS12]|uniref:hypothetical protein n=1 Tax=Pseudomonas sp. BMS12 TaxID=1796033 RepID=UPI0012901338|nr:hypothetical protein [Pseudomonas sp. BMS12]
MQYVENLSVSDFESKIQGRLYEDVDLRAAIKKHWRHLNIGSPVVEVVALFGNPDVKVFLSSGSGSDVYTAMFYAVRAKGDGYAKDVSEQRVTFYFDAAGKLYLAEPLNLNVGPIGSRASGPRLHWQYR